MSRFSEIWFSFKSSLANLFFMFSHRLILPLRYHVIIKGAEYLDPKKGGYNSSTLFLANHSSHIDGTIVAHELLKRSLPLSIWALDLTFKLPYLRWAARHVQVVKVPNINEKRSEKHSSQLHKLVTRTADGLRAGKNFLIFPAGRVKKTPIEKIDGKSAVPLIIQQCPEINIILVRITGLWGSRFSCATKPELQWATRSIRGSQMFWQLLKMVVLNGIFFIPRRKVTVEFMPAPIDFPRFGNRLGIGRYLERYYNEKWSPLGEPLNRVPDYFWKAQYIEHQYQMKNYKFDLNLVAKPIRNSVVALIADKANRDCKDIDFDMHLGRDLGFDSLDLVEILVALERRYTIKRLVPEDLTTVGHLIAIAAKISIVCEYEKGHFHDSPETKEPSDSRDSSEKKPFSTNLIT